MNGAIGVLAALAACLIGAGWQVVTRFGVTGQVDPIDLAMLRYGVPGLVLLPIWWRTGLRPAGVSTGILMCMVGGAGLPFGLAVMLAAQYAPVSHMAVLLPGTTPVFVAGFAALLLAQPVPRHKWVGFGVIFVGVFCIGWQATQTDLGQSWPGDLILLAAAAGWGIYSVAYRKSGLSPWVAVAVIGGWSLIVVMPLWVLLQNGALLSAPLSGVALQVVWQGVLAGVVGMWVYGEAMSRIGPANAASIGALVPALAAGGAWVFLGEVPAVVVLLGVALTCLGVLVAARG